MASRAILFLALVVGGGGCTKEKKHTKPYEEFYKVGFFGHGRGLAGELGINIWGFKRRCDSCHAVEKSVHLSMPTCNSCHQYHPAGWDASLVAIGHDVSLPLMNQKHHRRLECKKCHTDHSTRDAYASEISCTGCHSHNRKKTISHHDLMDRFDIDIEYHDERCLSCHVRTNKEYLSYYDPVTHQVLD